MHCKYYHRFVYRTFEISRPLVSEGCTLDRVFSTGLCECGTWGGGVAGVRTPCWLTWVTNEIPGFVCADVVLLH